MLEERQPGFPSRAAPDSEAGLFWGGRFRVLHTFPAGKTSCSSLSGSSTVHSGNSLLTGVKQLSLDERTPE